MLPRFIKYRSESTKKKTLCQAKTSKKQKIVEKPEKLLIKTLFGTGIPNQKLFPLLDFRTSFILYLQQLYVKL